jgi:sterol desaturase/sphingolipid hydroxylase (fatty acid hydroxylase superfamily)
MFTIFHELRLPILAAAVAGLWLAESLAPHFAEFVRDVRARRRHAVRNAALAAINGLLGIAALGALIAGSIVLAESRGLGLLRLVEWPGWTELAAAFILFDIWMYWWHRINHIVPFLWRFHRVHHSDPRMDVTTALRFHPGEIVLSTAARLAVVNLIGMELWHLALYELIATPVILFHHSNINLPRRVDNALRWLIVTPWMHWVHHSRLRAETHSNYASVLSVWDRVFGSYQFREDPDEIAFGLDEFPDDDKHQGVTGMIKTPGDK